MPFNSKTIRDVKPRPTTVFMS